jgi:hypothetical protein
MLNRLFLPFVVLCYWTEATPVNLDTLDFDKLDTNLDDLKYEAAEEDLDDYYDTQDEDEADSGNKPKTTLKTSGFKKKNTANIGLKTRYNEQDLKKFLKALGIQDKGSYSDDEIYAFLQGLAAQAVGDKATEERKYKKGTKTRGFHKVHHTDEYKKDKEFYEDDETNGTIKKVGGKVVAFKIGGGAGFDKGHFDHNRQKGIIGKTGYLNKGFLNKQFSGYSDAQGVEGSFNSEN